MAEPRAGTPEVLVVGGGLAGCECAWQLAERGARVTLVEQRPAARSAAHRTDALCELVCSNSLRSAALENAVGLLKHELRRCASLVMRAADSTRIAAGGALAVDRDRFAAAVTAAIEEHPRIRLVREHLAAVPGDRPCVLATGPLTSDDLAADLERRLGRASLSYFDAIAPVVDADSVDWGVVFRQSRLGRAGAQMPGDAEAYANCPLDESQYRALVEALRDAEQVRPRADERAAHFEGCLPVEVMAERGEMTLAFGPMKPVGLSDPRTGRRPFAVVQLRAENAARTAYNLVGFQTRMTHAAQRQVLRTIPGLENASFLRLGSMHRNTFVDAPRVLDETLQVRSDPGLWLAGQITGVEGYVESAACGLSCGAMLGARLRGAPAAPPPAETALGGLLGHLRREVDAFQPSNVTWALLEPLAGVRNKRERKIAMAQRALAAIDPWVEGTRR
jgi:methylenetetrahydrofolate--tRNA-(uracil-5-)-methyltransferase